MKNLEPMSMALKAQLNKSESWMKIILESIGFTENQEFFHQFIIDDKYIVDFALPLKNIIIEIDGHIHSWIKIKKQDIERDSYLRKKGWIIIRLKVKQVENEPSFCKSLIKQIYYE